MPQKKFFVEDIGEVVVTKKRKVKRINLRVVQNQVKVTQPNWLPFAGGLKFAIKNRSWIVEQQYKMPKSALINGQLLGKEHRLVIIEAPKLSTYVKNSQVILYLPSNKTLSDSEVIEAYKKAVKRAFKVEAQKYLPSRVGAIAKLHGFKFTSVRLIMMRSRWGSCNSKQVITLNILLMAAEWDLIDYVIVHELVHTRYMHHGKEFWAEVAQIIPDYKARQKHLKELQIQLAQYH